MSVKRHSSRDVRSLIQQLKLILYDGYQIILKYVDSLSNNDNNNILLLSIRRIFFRILSYIYRISIRIIGAFYWLLAPNMLFNLCCRHLVLFGIMFATPSIIRLSIKPLIKWIRYDIFLRIIMGKKWVKKYKKLLNKSSSSNHNNPNNQCNSYKEYAQCMAKLDEMNGMYAWKINKYSNLYSYNRIHSDLLELSKYRRSCDNYIQLINNNNNNNNINNNTNHPMKELMQFLRSRIERNYCGITNPALYSYCGIGTKRLIEDYIDNICQALHYICAYDPQNDPTISISSKIIFFNEIRHILGRTALCLSGGGTLGAYHVGVVLSMNKNNLLPKIITGSSVGSVIASLICTKYKNEFNDLTKDGILNLKYFDKKQNRSLLEGIYIRFRRFIRTGHFLDVTILRDCLKLNIGNITFLEAYHKTGRILNITVTGTDANTVPRLLNYLTAPNVVIWSAVIASCAIPFVFEPQELCIKRESDNCIIPIYLRGVTFSDGSISHDLPMNKISTLFNVDNFIVSQVNPHLVPFLFHSILAPIPLFERLFRFLAHEFQLYSTSILVNLREFGLLRGLRFINDLFTQKYTGDVTIVPDIPIKDYTKILSNPTIEYVRKCAHLSEKFTWKHISRLQGLCATEFTIDECLNELRIQLIKQNNNNLDKSSTINRVSSFQAPTSNIPNNNNIYNSILNNNNKTKLKSKSIFSVNIKSNSSPLLTSTIGIPTADNSNDSMHRSLSVAELCSDLSTTM